MGLSSVSVGSGFIFFFKQKTAYEMRISDWSSDVCSSDLGRQTRNRFSRGRRDSEAQLRRQPHRAQHAHRVFAVTCFRIADQTQYPILYILEATNEIAHRKIFDSVIQGIGGKVAAYRIVFDAAVDVVAHQAPILQLTVAGATIGRAHV